MTAWALPAATWLPPPSRTHEWSRPHCATCLPRVARHRASQVRRRQLARRRILLQVGLWESLGKTLPLKAARRTWASAKPDSRGNVVEPAYASVHSVLRSGPLAEEPLVVFLSWSAG